MAIRHEPSAPGLFHVLLGVEPSARKKGIGDGLLTACIMQAKPLGLTKIWGEIRETDTESIGFFERRHAQRESYCFESVLDLSTYETKEPPVTESDFEIFEFSPKDRTESEALALFELLNVTELDEPSAHLRGQLPYSLFMSKLNKQPFQDNVLVVARVEQQFVGLCWIIPHAGSHYNDFTGVLSPFRRRGIAKALKIAATNLAKQRGFKNIRTHNDTRNAAMISINNQLGYATEPGVYIYTLTLDQ